jgi:hypothetical protein
MRPIWRASQGGKRGEIGAKFGDVSQRTQNLPTNFFAKSFVFNGF